MQPEGVLEAEQESKSRRGRRGGRHKTPKSRPSLSVNQKVKIAEEELDHIKKEQEEAATNAEKLIDSLRVRSRARRPARAASRACDPPDRPSSRRQTFASRS